MEYLVPIREVKKITTSRRGKGTVKYKNYGDKKYHLKLIFTKYIEILCHYLTASFSSSLIIIRTPAPEPPTGFSPQACST